MTRSHRTTLWAGLTGALLLLTACQSLRVDRTGPVPPDPAVEAARAQYEAGQLSQALIACVDIAHRNPQARGLAKLRRDIMTALTEQRMVENRIRRDDSASRMVLESEEDALLPDSFGLRRFLQGNDSTHVRPRSKLDEWLDKTVSLHFDEVDIQALITQLGTEHQLNMVADQGLASAPITIHADRITLRELFDYLARNFDLDFHLGQNLVWITQAQESRTATPLYTRLYRLRHGGNSGGLSSAGLDATALPLLEAIERFVPVAEGSDFLFDSHAHILIVRNTERNLALVDQLVEALDVTPPQVLIEARFITTGISDLRELGIDWLLQDSVALTETRGRTRSQIDSGASIDFTDSLNASEGLNAVFSGILTDPQFRAVLHALQINGDARTLSAPKVLAVNNRPATIRIGRDLAYVSDVDFERESFGTGEDREELLIQDPVVDTLETGYQLETAVSVGANRRDITLKLRPEIVELIRFREVGRNIVNTNNANGVDGENGLFLPVSGIEFPELARSTIDTEVIIQSGETVVMGGLMRQREQKEIRGVPILSAIPLLGELFTRESVTREQENLLVFVTATLISKHGEDLVPHMRSTPAAAETRGRFIENNAPMDETFTD